MASSFVDKGEFGFWANDGFVEAMQICIINEIENSGFEMSKPWLSEYKSQLALQALPLICGGMSMELEQHIIDERRTDTLVSLIDSILKKIDSDPSYLTGNTLNSFRKRAMEILLNNGTLENEEEFQRFISSSNWEGAPIESVKNNYRQSFELLKKLLNNNVATTASSPIDYWKFD